MMLLTFIANFLLNKYCFNLKVFNYYWTKYLCIYHNIAVTLVSFIMNTFVNHYLLFNDGILVYKIDKQ